MKYRILLFFCAISLLLIILWQQLFHLPLVIVPYHMMVMVPLHFICLSIIALVYSRWQSRFYMIAKVGAWGFLVSLFYVLIFGSVHFWGDIVTLRILYTYICSFPSFLHSLPFSYTEIWIGIIAFIAIHYLLAFIFSKKIAAALLDMAEGLRVLQSKIGLRNDPHPQPLSEVEGGNSLFENLGGFRVHKKLLLALCLLAILLSPFLLRGKRVIHKAGEPMMVMLFDHMWGVTDNPLFSARRIRVGIADSRLRKEYTNTPAAARRKNVILIIVDALRADHLSAYGYKRKTSPYIDALIADRKAVKVDRCYSTCACTLCGVTSILLSRTWNEAAVNGFNIVGLLHDRGYHNYALISGAHKEWYNMAKFYSDDCDYYDGKDAKKYYFKDDRVLLEGMERIGAYSDTPSFFYFHLQSTHETGLLQDKYAVYKPYKKSLSTQGMNGESAINEYDDKVLQADDMIRQLMEALDQKGYLKNSMVIITADHGQGLGEHGVSGHVDWLYDPQVSVPLIICDDSISLYHNLTFARHIDIAPTIVDRLGLPKPASWMGMSLLNDGVEPYSYHETGKNGLETGQQKYMIIYHLSPALSPVTGRDRYGEAGVQNTVLIPSPSPREKGAIQNAVLIPSSSPREKGEVQTPAVLYKYIFTADYRQEELYELVTDPMESYNLCAEQKQVLEMLRAKARAEMKRRFGNE